MKKLYEYDPTSKEYADLSVADVDRMAFGFAEEDITEIMPGKLNIRWHDDMLNPEEAIRIHVKNGGTREGWAKTVDLSEPIQLSHKGGKLFIEDGHHRYTAAKILNHKLLVDEVVFRDNPYVYAVNEHKREILKSKLTKYTLIR